MARGRAVIQCGARTRRLHSDRGLGILFIYGLMALLSACAVDDEETPPTFFKPKLSQPPVCRNSFSIKNLSLTHVDGSTLLFRFTADLAIDRPRTGQMSVFNNYYEIRLSNMTLDQPLNGPVATLDLKGVNKAVQSFDDDKLSNEDKPSEEAWLDFSSCSLSRVLVDNIRINLMPPKRLPIVLMADSAKMGADTELIKFERNVKLNARQCELSAQTAIWSNKYNGMFLPAAYTINGRKQHRKKHSTGDFFQISREGRCLKLRPTPAVEYLDMLDEADKELSTHLPPMFNGLGF